MDSHFGAFSFVDRITGLQPGARIQGRYAIPPAVEAFPASLVAEAVGQLAAWAAMAAVGFSHRPVAGIAGGVELLSAVRPGQMLELAAELESVDTDTAAYSGTAHADGIPALRLQDCVGPMLPVKEFDNPQSLRDRFTLLSSSGAEPGAFQGVASPSLERGSGEPGRLARAILHVPQEAALFSDHFPRRKVFPGTLLMHAKLQTAALLAGEVDHGEGVVWAAQSVSEVKLRTFIAPGETLNLEARLTGRSETSLSVAVESRVNHRLVGSAEVWFVTREEA